MPFLPKETHKFHSCRLEIIDIHGEIFNDYPNVIGGHLFHFTFSETSIDWNANNSKLSLEFHWKKEIDDVLENLKIKQFFFEEEILATLPQLSETIDQFGYINSFIVTKNNQHQLVISSDSFDLSELIKAVEIRENAEKLNQSLQNNNCSVSKTKI